MSLKQTVQQVHKILGEAGVDHALIGGLALASHGVHRATKDVDLLIHSDDALKAKTALMDSGFSIFFESAEVLQLDGASGLVDVLFARRPLSRDFLKSAKVLAPFGIKCVAVEHLIALKIQAYSNNPGRELQDKADIVALISAHPALDWTQLKAHADLFGQWIEIERLRILSERKS